MWNFFSGLGYPQIEIPDPETPSAESLLSGAADFIERYPLAVGAVIIAIFIVRSWQKGSVAKGIIIGALVVIVFLFFLRGVLGGGG